MKLDVQREYANRTAAIRGRVDNRTVNLLVKHGQPDGNTHVNGHMGEDLVDLTFGLSTRGGVKSATGFFGKTRIDSQFNHPKGDTAVTQLGQEMLIDYVEQEDKVLLESNVVSGSMERSRYDGDEQGRISVGSNVYDYTVDRNDYSQAKASNTSRFTIAGQGPNGPFELEQAVALDKTVGSFEGTLPEGMKMFPVLWEILGDFAQTRTIGGEFPTEVMAMSTFFVETGTAKAV